MALTKVSTGVVDMSQNTGGLVIAKGITAQQPTCDASTLGSIRENTTENKVEVCTSTGWQFLEEVGPTTVPLTVDYLVVAGGGGAYYSGGGGGGYRTNVVGDLSGGNSTAEPAFMPVPEQVYTVTVGGGGPGGYRTSASQLKGGDSTFDTITSIGGGKSSNLWTSNGYPGGSGGGANVLENDYASTSGGAGTAGQGYRGGNASNGAGDVTAGGGGAGGRGGDLYGSSGWSGTPGGAGLVSSIDGLSQTRSKGGDGGVSVPANPYGANTGAGGQGSNNSGLSGVVILRYPENYTVTKGGSLISSVSTSVLGYKVETFTSGTGTITFA